jgi:hypothetical protein
VIIVIIMFCKHYEYDVNKEKVKIETPVILLRMKK